MVLKSTLQTQGAFLHEFNNQHHPFLDGVFIWKDVIDLAHKHSVYDSDVHFSIDPISRAISRVVTDSSPQKVMLMQHDHNSERFTFELPRYIEEHDMSLCDTVEVHYLNIDVETKAQSKGVCKVEDLQISPDSEDVVICSWLIEYNATKYMGSLNFVVRFACTTGTEVDYAWNTAIFSGISISKGMYNGEDVIDEYLDILKEWKAELDGSALVDIEQVVVAQGDEAVNTLRATFGDGRTKDFEVQNGSRGERGMSAYEQASDAGYEGTETEFINRMLGTPFSIKTTNGVLLNFFIGTQAQFDALAEKDPNTIYYITDHDTVDDLYATIDAKVHELETKLATGEAAISRALIADRATNADSADYAESAFKATQVFGEQLNDDLLTKAEQVTDGIYHYRLGGDKYTGTISKLPENNSRYSSATVYKRGIEATVILWGGSASKMYRRCYNGTTWGAWEEFVTTANIADQSVASAKKATSVAMTKASGNSNQYVVTTSAAGATNAGTVSTSNLRYNPYTDTVTAANFNGTATNANTATLATRIQFTINLKINNTLSTKHKGSIIYWSNGVKQIQNFEVGSGASPTYTLSNIDAGSILAIGGTYMGYDQNYDFPGFRRYEGTWNSVIGTEFNIDGYTQSSRMCFTVVGGGYGYFRLSDLA